MTEIARNPRWGDAQRTFITLTLVVEAYGAVELNAMPNDPEPHGRDLYARCLAGEFGEIAPFRFDAATVLRERAQRLHQAQTATAGLADAFVAGLLDDTEAARFKAWAAYQRDLARLDAQPGFPDQIVWPKPPAD